MAISRRNFISGSGAAAAALRFGPIWADDVKYDGKARILAECETVFFGASAFAVAAASCRSSKCVIIERNLSPAAEFSGALVPNILTEPSSAAAKDILSVIKSEGLAANGLCHTPPVSDVVSQFVLRKKINLFLNAEITAVDRKGGMYEVGVIGSDGRSVVRCQRIVDTTPCAWRDAKSDAVKAKYLAAALVGSSDRELSRFSVQGGELLPGALAGETYFRIQLPPKTDWTEARLKLHETFEKFAASPGCPFKMGAEATEFGYVYDSPTVAKKIAENWDWLPGLRYSDLVSALDGGALWS
jgi:hypothetical protein